MKKNLLLLILMIITLGFVSCSDNDVDNGGSGSSNITVTDLDATYNSVTFTASTSDASATLMGYIVKEKGTEITAQEVFRGQTTSKWKEGPLTQTGLVGNTEYTLYVVTSGSNGLSAIYSIDFKTKEDSGLPTSAMAAGMRVMDFSETNANIRVINGSGVDYSYVRVIPTVFMENYLIDNTLDETEYLKSLAANIELTGTIKVMGANTEKYLDYNSDYADKLLPDMDYTLMSVGVKTNGDKEELGDLTLTNFTSKSFNRIGNPKVDITTPYVGWIAITYKFTPNADTDWILRYATDKSQVDAFTTWMTNKYGAEGAQKRLKEFVRIVDGLYETNEQNKEFTENLTYGFDFEPDHYFSMLALGLDKNLMPGDQLSRNDEHLLAIPDSEKGTYSISITEVGAHYFNVHVHMDKNCGAVYFAMVGAEQEFDPNSIQMARSLWEEGWGVGPKTDSNAEGDYDIFYFADVLPGQNYKLISTSLNYFGGLNTVRASEVINTKTLKEYNGYSQKSTIAYNGATKETMKLHYSMDPSDKLLWHRIMVKGEWDNLSDNEIIDLLLGAEGNEWEVKDADYGYSFDWIWTGMEPNTEYTYFYVTEDADGNISKLNRIEGMKTMNADGGVAPAINSIDVTDITANSCRLSINVNNDVASYQYLLIGDVDNEFTALSDAEKAVKFKELIGTAGVPATDNIVNQLNEGLSANTNYYVVALPFGAQLCEGAIKWKSFTTLSSRAKARASVSKTKVTKSPKLYKSGKGSIKKVTRLGAKSNSIAIKKNILKGKKPTFTVQKYQNSANLKNYPNVHFLDMKAAPYKLMKK